MRSSVLLFFTLILGATAWDDDDLEIFDVVEEVNQNFYELIGVAQVIKAIMIRISLSTKNNYIFI